MMACVLASCSSDGSRDIQIDEVKFVGESNAWSHKSFDKVSTLFEVVPGKYPISWKLVNDLPQAQQYNVELKLKLRLKKKVNIRPEVYEEMSNATYWHLPFMAPFSFSLLNSDGESVGIGVSALHLDYLPYGDWQSKGIYNKDQMMDFINFLASEPGTEMEVVCNCEGGRSGDIDCIKEIKNARGIQCNMTDDKDFENSIGHIVD